MIVQPDFITHWKTRKLCNLLRKKDAPLYVIRIWALCQTSRSDIIPSDPETIKAICEYDGDAKNLVRALSESGYLDANNGDGFKVHQWAEVNGALIHNWTVGPLGGRPKGSGKKTQGKPKGLPNVTDGVDGLDGVDGVDKKEGVDGGVAPPPFDFEKTIPSGASCADFYRETMIALSGKLTTSYSQWYENFHSKGITPTKDTVAAVNVSMLNRPGPDWGTYGNRILEFAIMDLCKTHGKKSVLSGQPENPVMPMGRKWKFKDGDSI